MVNFFDLKAIYNKQMDLLLASSGLSTEVEFNFGITNNHVCPNCIYDANLKKSSGKYKVGGPTPFPIGKLCPYCNGSGSYGVVKSEPGYLAIIWDYKKWINPPPQIDNPDGYIQTICDKQYLTQIKGCKDLTVLYNVSGGNPVFQLYGEPNPAGLGDNNYLICLWKKTGVVSTKSNPSMFITPTPSRSFVSVTPTNTPTQSPTSSITPTITPTITSSVSVTPTNTLTPTNTSSGTTTPTPTISLSPTNTITPTSTITPSPTSTQTPPPTPTSTQTPTPTITPSSLIAFTNSANYRSEADWNGQNGNVTTVGSNGKSSFYGTYDQSGNVYEWNESIIALFRGIRGGFYESLSNEISSTYRSSFLPSSDNGGIGFRICSYYNPLNLDKFVYIEDALNPADLSGYGSVSYEYYMQKNLITNSEYVEFLNSVDSIGINPYEIYNPIMTASSRGGILFDSNLPNGEKYYIKTNMFNKPVNFINWYNCARYCNWLHNEKPAQPAGLSTTEDGAYTLNNNIGLPVRNPNALYFIPTEDEWYKAAFYKGGLSSGYWLYATQSDNEPQPVCATLVGNGDPLCIQPAVTRTPTSSLTVTPTTTPAIPLTPTPTQTPTRTSTPALSATPTPTPTNIENSFIIYSPQEISYTNGGVDPYPPSPWTSILNSNIDDSFYAINLPFNWKINNTSYNRVFLGSNTYITFGSGSTAYTGFSASSPARNKIFLGAGDNSVQRICTLTYLDEYVKIRYEGTALPTGVPGSPDIVLEITFFNPANKFNKNVVEIITGLHNRTSGLFGIASTNSWYAQSTISANTSYVIEGDPSGTSFVIHNNAHINEVLPPP